MSKGQVDLGRVIVANEVVEFDFLSTRRIMPPRKEEIFLIQFQVDEETFIRWGGFPTDATGKVGAFWSDRSGWQEHEETQTTPKTKRTPKREAAGRFSAYWHSLMRQSFFETRPVLALMRRLKHRPEETDKKLLQRLFEVDTRADIAADEFRLWLYEQLKANEMDGLERKDIARMLRVAEEKQAAAEGVEVNGAR